MELSFYIEVKQRVGALLPSSAAGFRRPTMTGSILFIIFFHPSTFILRSLPLLLKKKEENHETKTGGVKWTFRILFV